MQVTTPAFQVVRRRAAAATPPDAASNRELFIIEESLGYLVNFLARSFTRSLARRLTQHGVPGGQWAVLMFLWAEDGQTQKALSQQAGVEESTTARSIDRMERDGVVRRLRNPRDRRQVNVYLTEKGRALRDVLVPCARAVNEAAARPFSASEQRDVRDMLQRMIAALDDAALVPDEAQR